MGLEDLNIKRQGLVKMAIDKIAMETDVKGNIKKLITQQAYEDISDRYKKLAPLILGIDIVEEVSDTIILASAKLAIPGKNILIPIVYSSGVIDSTTFVYNQDTDILLGLTPKIVNIITSDNGNLTGTAVSGSAQRFDNGSIDKLFIPPQTFSPKIASQNLLVRMMETSDLLKVAVYRKMCSDTAYKSQMEAIYGEEIYKLAASGYNHEMNRIAATDLDEPIVLTSKKAILESDWMHKSAALKEYYENGMAISQGKDRPTKTLLKVATVGEDLQKQFGVEELGMISAKSQGAFLVLGEGGSYEEVFMKPNREDLDAEDDVKLASVKRVRISHDGFYAALPLDISKSKTLEPFSAKKFAPAKKKVYSRSSGMDRKDVALVIFKKNDIDFVLPHLSLSDSRLTTTDKTYVLDLNLYSNKRIVIDKGSDKDPVEIDDTIYVGENKIKMIARNNSETFHPLAASSLSKTANYGEIINVSFDGAEFLYKRAMYSPENLSRELLDYGLDKFSVYKLLKTAKTEGSVSLEAINAKIEMLSNMVMNLAGASNPSVSEQEIAPEEQAVAPTEQEMAPAGQEEVPEESIELVDGMNPATDAEVLAMLTELKESSVMDMSILTTVASSTGIGEVISQYRDDIQSGVSAVARILLNMMTQKESVVTNMGEAKYNQLIASMKPLLVKMSDLYADIYFLKMESDVGA